MAQGGGKRYRAPELKMPSVENGASQAYGRIVASFGKMASTAGQMSSQGFSWANQITGEMTQQHAQQAQQHAQQQAKLVEGYKAQASNDITKNLQDLYLQYPDDPGAFNASAISVKTQTLNNVDPSIAEDMGRRFDSQANNMSFQIGKSRNRIDQKNASDNVTLDLNNQSNQIEKTIADGDYIGTSESIQEYNNTIDSSLQYNELEKQQMKQSSTAKFRSAIMREELDSMPTTEASAALNEYSKNRPDAITQDNWDKIIKENGGYIRDKEALNNNTKAAIQIENEKISADYALKLPNSAAPTSDLEAEIDGMYNSGVISINQYTQFNKTVQKRDEQNKEINMLQAKFASKGGNSAQPSSPDGTQLPTMGSAERAQVATDPFTQSEADKLYKANKGDYEAGDNPTASMSSFVNTTGYVPKDMKNTIMAGLRSPDETVVRTTMDLVDRLDDIRGIDDGYVTKEQRAFATQYTNNLKYLDPDKAFAQARATTDPKDSDRLTQRQESFTNNWKTGRKQDDYFFKTAKSGFDESFFGNTVTPTVQAELSNDLKDLTEAYYMSGMDIQQSEKQAIKDMKRVWGTSTISGSKETMKYPPENYYGPNDNDWMGTQLRSDIDVEYPGLIPTDAKLIVKGDANTAREDSDGASPSYQVFYIDAETNQQVPISDILKHLTWFHCHIYSLCATFN